MSLMKISTYHKNRGDKVFFIKGIKKLTKSWDRIYITTLFTFHYSDVIKTINYYKPYVSNQNNIFVGGILATLLHDDLLRDSGVSNIIKGRLLDSALLGFNDHINIDLLPLDYDILSDTDYQYPSGDNFFAYTTRGCINHCPFCAVPELEGNLQITNNIVEQIMSAQELYGDKRNLLLMDNNVLALPANSLKKIVNDLNELGFVNTPTFQHPSAFLKYFDMYHRYISEKKCTTNIEKKLSMAFEKLTTKHISKIYREQINDLLSNIGAMYANRTQMILDNIDFFIKIEKKYSYKKPMQRFVDFNQGMDARLLTPEKMGILSQLPIRPFRIAYDKIKLTDIYTNAIRLAAQYGTTIFSNYLLYNFNDTPIDLYKRLEINISLAEELNVHIYSFPMKFEPIENKKRGHIDSNWNYHYLRSIKAILNVSNGVFGGDRSFFEKAFGHNEVEFYEILSMPKDLLTYRTYYESLGITTKWLTEFRDLPHSSQALLLNLISKDIYHSDEARVNDVLRYYNPQHINKKKGILNI